MPEVGSALAFCTANRAIYNASPAMYHWPIGLLLLLCNELHHFAPMRHSPCCNHDGWRLVEGCQGSSANDRKAIRKVCRASMSFAAHRSPG